MIQQCKSFIGILSLILLLSCSSKDKEHDLIVDFNGLYGQIEIGGKYVGIEFHKSRPLPSRISFYYPVANSIDLSTDYWQRDQSLPLNLILKSNSGMDTLGLNPLPYRYTPYRIQFDEKKDDLKISYSYDVCDDLPLLVLRIALKNMSIQSQTISLLSQFDMRIRTSHSYQWIDSDSIRFNNKRTTAIADFERQDADSTAIFIANSGLLPEDGFLEYENMQENPRVNFAYQYQIDAGEEIEIIQLIGSCRIRETENMINQSMRSWKESIIKNRDRVLNYTFDQDFFYIDDPALQQTVYWSKAILASNIHYIDHSFLPMPCPAEYNFFFTIIEFLNSNGVNVLRNAHWFCKWSFAI